MRCETLSSPKAGSLAADVVVVGAGPAGCSACQTHANGLMPIQRGLLFAQAVSAFLYRLPGMGHLLLTSPSARVPLMAGFSRGLPLLDIFRCGYRFWLGSRATAAVAGFRPPRHAAGSGESTGTGAADTNAD